MNNKQDESKPSGLVYKGRQMPSRKRGAFMASASAVAIILAFAINLVLSRLPKSALEFDMTGNSLYTVSEKSKELLNDLSTDVEIIILAKNENVEKRLLKLIYSYAGLSPHISVREIDPAIYPAALEQYEAAEHSVVVRCAETGKSEVINIDGFEGQTDGLIIYDVLAYYQSGAKIPVALDAEGKLTSAVSYVTGEMSAKIYTLEGHGEESLGNNAAALIKKANIGSEPVNLLKAGGVPKDSGLLLCVNPATDLADDELSMLLLYLRSGGKIMLLLDNPALPNFNVLLETYGLRMRTGYIADTERYYENFFEYYGYNCIYPVLSSSSGVTSGIKEDALLILARGMEKVTPRRTESFITPFMTTSANGLNLIDEYTSEEGEFILGAAVTETVNNKESRLTVISTVLMINDDITSSVSSASNLDIFINAVTANLDNVSLTVIHPKSLSLSYNTLENTTLWSVFFIGVIPVLFAVYGLVVWIGRRRR